jgi:nitrite reductase (NADH) large subunit
MNKRKLVIVGNGMAAGRLLEAIVARPGRERLDIVVFGDEPYGNYNRILLSGVLANTHHPKDISLNPLAWYREHDIALHAGVRIEAIDLDRRIVRGESIIEKYDELVFATGSNPFIPPIEGARQEGVFVFRTLDDCARIASFAKNVERAAVIGGGLLGLEAARGLLELGPEVHVVHLMSHLMELQLDAKGGGILKAALEKMGVRIHLSKSTQAILGDGRVTGLRFADDSELACEMVVISAGIRPNTAFRASSPQPR